MPKHRKRSRSRRRRNPIPRWGIALGGVAAAAALGYGGYRYVKHRKAAALPGKEGAGGPGQIACEIGPDYPGFVQAEDGACIPSGTTPAGIYVDRDCQDFVFVAGDDGPQVDNLETLVDAMAIQSQKDVAPSADPLVLAIGFLHRYWPACNWPPTADSPARLVHMFEALCFLITRSIIEKGGRVLGTKSQDVAAEIVADRLGDLGLPAFDLQIVPELAEWVSQDGGLGKAGGVAEPSEIQRLKAKLCDAPGEFTAFEKILFINEVVSPILDTRVAALGPDPSLKQLDTMFANIAAKVAQHCSVPKRPAARALAKKFAHDLWVQRYHGGVGIDTSPPPMPPPPVQPGGGFKPPKLPQCYIEPFLRNKTHVSDRKWYDVYDPYEITVFEHTGVWSKCDDFDLFVGICLQVVGTDKPYGYMSNFAADLLGNVDLFAIQNTQQQPIHWSQFRAPPTYKRQLHWRIRNVLGNLEISPVTDVTGNADGHVVDPCPTQEGHWPIPANTIFNVIGADGKWYEWKAEPKITLVKDGKKVALQIQYTGVPVFAAGGGGPMSARATFFPSKTQLQIHSMAKGRTP